jgi:hypothetical protein
MSTLGPSVVSFLSAALLQKYKAGFPPGNRPFTKN